jgi:hypothetical protein
MKRQGDTRSGGVHFVKDEEECLVFVNEDLLDYQKKMPHALLPEKNEALLRHLTHLMAFLDAVYQLFYHKEWLVLANQRRQKSEESDDDDGDDGVGIVSSETTSISSKKKKRRNFNSLFETYDEQVEANNIAEERRTTFILDNLALGMINETVFQWHVNIMQRGDAMTGMYATCYFYSWSAFARTFHLTIYSKEEKLYRYTSRCGLTDPFCSLVSKHENVVVTKKEIINYSVNDLWDSACIIRPALYSYIFCLPMKDYVYTLFFRYCDLLSLIQQQQQEEHQETNEAIFDNPLFVEVNTRDRDEEEEDEDVEEMYDAFKRVNLNTDTNYSIQTDFLFEGEMLFYYQLHRIHLSDRLQTLYETRALTLSSGTSGRRMAWLQVATKGWLDSMVMLAKHAFLRSHVIEAFQHDVYEIQLHHGERECYRRKNTESMCEARDVLDDCRTSVLHTVTETVRTTLEDVLTGYATTVIDNLKKLDKVVAPDTECDALEKIILNEGTDAWPLLTHEKECVLLTRVSTILWLDSEQVKDMERVDRSLLLEELHSLDPLESLIFDQFTAIEQTNKHIPIFVKLMRLYYVIVVVPGKGGVLQCRLFKSVFFIEAYFVWLALCVSTNVFVEAQLQPNTKKLVVNFNKLILF